MTVWVWVARLWPYALGAFSALVAYLSYKRGYKKGTEFAVLAGAHCDVCNKIHPRFVFFRNTVMCTDCYNSILSNKEMKCRLCDHKIEECVCT